MIQIFGVKELDEFFLSLSKNDQTAVILESYRQGSKPIIIAAKQLLRSRIKRKTKRNLEKSIGFVSGKKNPEFVSGKIGARRFGEYRGFHGHLYNDGTNDRITKKGWKRGRMPATSFFSNSVAAKGNEAIANISSSMLSAMTKKIESQISKIKTQ